MPEVAQPAPLRCDEGHPFCGVPMGEWCSGGRLSAAHEVLVGGQGLDGDVADLDLAAFFELPQQTLVDRGRTASAVTGKLDAAPDAVGGADGNGVVQEQRPRNSTPGAITARSRPPMSLPNHISMSFWSTDWHGVGSSETNNFTRGPRCSVGAPTGQAGPVDRVVVDVA